MTTEQELNQLRKDIAITPKEALATLIEMNELAAEIARLRDEESTAHEAKKSITAKLEAKEERAIELLLDNGITSYKAPFGTLSMSFRLSAKLPVGPAKEAFMEHLKAVGRYNDMVSVNSQTYNSYVKEQYDLAQEQGLSEPTIPGVTDVKTSPRLSFRRS